MSVRRNTTAIVVYLIIIVLGIAVICLTVLRARFLESLLILLLLPGIGLGTVCTGIYAWVRGLGGHIEGDTNTPFYFRWWDFVVIPGIYIVSIGIFIFLILLFFGGGRY